MFYIVGVLYKLNNNCVASYFGPPAYIIKIYHLPDNEKNLSQADR